MHPALLLIAVLSSHVQAPDTLEVAAVTAERNASVVSASPLRRLSSLQMERTGAVELQEALRALPGINVKDYGGIGGLKTVSIRSFGAAHTGISYDGFVIGNAQNGQVDIGRFHLEDVRDVTVDMAGNGDIFRGARLAASAGTVSINSVRPQFDGSCLKASARMRVASFDTYNPYIGIDWHPGRRWSVGVRADYLNSEGDYPFILKNGGEVTEEKRLNSDVSSLSTELNVWGDVGQSGEVRMRVSLYDSERGLPGSVVLYTKNPVERLWDRDWTAGCSYSTSVGDGWKVKGALGWNSAWNRYTDADPSYSVPVDDRYRQEETSCSLVTMWAPEGSWSASVAYDAVLNTLGANLPDFIFPTRLTSLLALSLKYGSERVTAMGALLGTSVREHTHSGKAAQFGDRLSPSASVSVGLTPSGDLRARASFKESYRLPTFNDLYYPRVGGKSLSPEKAEQLNLGLTWTWQKGSHDLSMTMDVYRNLVRDKIVAVPTMFIWSMRNVGRVEVLGYDLSAVYVGEVAQWLKIRFSSGYSYQYAVDVTDPDAKNFRHQIAYTPRHSGSGTLVLELPWMNLGYTLVASGERYTLAQNTPAYKIEPYADHTVSVNRTFGIGDGCELHLSAEVLNLGGTNYEIIRYYPMPGRSFRLSVKLTL